jgi:hypothetical protein
MGIYHVISTLAWPSLEFTITGWICVYKYILKIYFAGYEMG